MSHHFESYFKLHPNQISGQNERSAIDEIVTLVQTVQERWKNKKLAAALFMDVKEAFDHLSKAQLIAYMIEMGIDKDLVL